MEAEGECPASDRVSDTEGEAKESFPWMPSAHSPG